MPLPVPAVCTVIKPVGIKVTATLDVGDEFPAKSTPYASIVFSYADHGFFCDAKAAYNPEAAKEAWVLTLAFLKTKLGN